MFNLTVGDVVYFTAKHGGDVDKQEALKLLTVGQKYTVDKILQSSWITHIKLTGQDELFNSVLFEKV